MAGPDKVIDIPGVGSIAFPDSMSDAEMNAAATRLYQGANPTKKQPPVKSWVETASDWLPGAGGAIGGMVGGKTGAAIGAAAGEGYKQLAQHATEIPGAIADVARNAIAQPGATARGFAQGAGAGAVNAGTQAVVQGALPQAAGEVIGAGMKAAAPWLMQKALKPAMGLLNEYKTTAPKLVQTLLDEGVSVTQGGLDKLQRLFDATNQEIRDAVANATGTIDKKNVAARALPTAVKVAQQVNPTKDLQAVGETVGEFLDHPILSGPTLSVPDAQAMKVGTYKAVGKKYGEVSSAAIETQKALARGLKEEIATEVPGIAGLNAKDSELMAALDAVGRRVALAGNKDPIGFAWVAAHPTTFLAALFDRSPAVKSMIARGLYQTAGAMAKVSPQLIRSAVTALASTEPQSDAPPAGAPGE